MLYHVFNYIFVCNCSVCKDSNLIEIAPDYGANLQPTTLVKKIVRHLFVVR